VKQLLHKVAQRSSNWHKVLKEIILKPYHNNFSVPVSYKRTNQKKII